MISKGWRERGTLDMKAETLASWIRYGRSDTLLVHGTSTRARDINASIADPPTKPLSLFSFPVKHTLHIANPDHVQRHKYCT
jgi:hypothetical protein